ncbi:hypothetical protein DL764_001325 [Monosporascus ibericus]|uniref:Major facilitator superfamily (MFS) profile domain-containing protein n=1 Tax=Monosporascus ibericus TaxID=155417 RepID=A0A4Q4TSH1_9PEZI|nr:hypothetical protein DL764_001325 [Monosporascus ibericus]
MTSPFTGAIYSPGINQIVSEFRVSRLVATVGLSAWTADLGPAFGSIRTKMASGGPLSHRRHIHPLDGYSKRLYKYRYYTLSHWAFRVRPSYAIMVYSVAVSIGPTLGPVVGGAIIEAGVDWRWLQYLAGILQLAVVALDILLVSESSPAILLVRKAGRRRASTGNWALHAQYEEWRQVMTIRYYVRKFAIRPFQMLATPICFSVALYASFIYAVIYATLAAFPAIFERGRGLDKVAGSLPFVALMIGIILGIVPVALNQRFYNGKFAAAGASKVVPEARLPGMMFGSGFFAVGLFITG